MISPIPKNDIAIEKLKTVLDCLITASPKQREKLTRSFCDTFPEFNWEEKDLIQLLTTVMEEILNTETIS